MTGGIGDGSGGGTQTATLGESRGLAGLGQLPAFDLPAAGGGRVRSWDFRGRRHLVLWLAGDRPDPEALAAAAGRAPAIRAEDGALLVVLQVPDERAAEIGAAAGFGGPVLVDGDGRVHARIAGGRPLLLVADRNGTAFWRAPLAGGAAPGVLLDEAVSWLEYLNILEHECGTCVPAWPVEELGWP